MIWKVVVKTHQLYGGEGSIEVNTYEIEADYMAVVWPVLQFHNGDKFDGKMVAAFSNWDMVIGLPEVPAKSSVVQPDIPDSGEASADQNGGPIGLGWPDSNSPS